MRTISNLTAIIGMVMIGAVSTANAGAISDWNFNAYGGFSGLDYGFPNPVYDAMLAAHGDMGSLCWGIVADPLSHLTINDRVSPNPDISDVGNYYSEASPVQPGVTSLHGETIGRIQTGDAMGEAIGWTTHYNNPIFVPVDEARTAVNYHLQLFDPDTNALAWNSGEMFFFIEMLETQNNLDPCPDGNPHGEYPNQNGCADRFRFGLLADFDGDGDIDLDDLLAAPIEPSFDEIIASFNYEDVNYSVGLSGFWDIGDNGLELVGEGWSPERDFKHFEVRANVSIVPSPTTLALALFGLAALGVSSSRRRIPSALSGI